MRASGAFKRWLARQNEGVFAIRKVRDEMSREREDGNAHAKRVRAIA